MPILGLLALPCSGDGEVVSYFRDELGYDIFDVTIELGKFQVEVDPENERGNGGNISPRRQACLDIDRQIIQRWKDKLLITGLLKSPELLTRLLLERPHFILAALTVPTGRRWKLFQEDQPKGDFQLFISSQSEAEQRFSSALPLCDLVFQMAAPFCPLLASELQETLNRTGLLRPDWDLYFMRLAFLAASRANCMKRRVGAVVVRDRRLVSTGYNGTPSGIQNCADGGCVRCNNPRIFQQGEGLELCHCLHAEANALLEAGTRNTPGTILYVTHLPCLGCAKLAVQAGVSRVVYGSDYDSGSTSSRILAEAGVTLEQFSRCDLLSCIRRFFMHSKTTER